MWFVETRYFASLSEGLHPSLAYTGPAGLVGCGGFRVCVVGQLGRVGHLGQWLSADVQDL